MIFYCISELMLTSIQIYNKKHFISRSRDLLKFDWRQVPHFMIVLIPYFNICNLSWIIKCLFNFEEYGAFNFKIDLSKVEVPTSINGLRCKLLKLYNAIYKGFENAFIF